MRYALIDESGRLADRKLAQQKGKSLKKSGKTGVLLLPMILISSYIIFVKSLLTFENLKFCPRAIISPNACKKIELG